MSGQQLDYQTPPPRRRKGPSKGWIVAALTMAIIGLIVLLDEFLWRLTLILWTAATIILLVHRARSRRADFE